MAELPKTTGAAVPTNDLLVIDEICDRYEQALIAGGQPRLADALTEVPERAWTALLGELLLIETYRGTTVDTVVEGMKLAHPELAQQLDAAIALVKHRITTNIFSESPTLANDVARGSDIVSPSSKTIDIACPHCGCSLPISIDAKAAEVDCRACGNTFSLASDSTNSGRAISLKTVGQFQLISRLGVGGCGTVWKAYDTKLDRTVAIKIPRSGLLDRGEEERFLREARTVAQLVHPNIVSVHEIGHDGDLNYFVSDFVRGMSLSDWMTGNRMSHREAAEFVAKVSDALHYAHEQGVVHRDMKPSNIMLDSAGEPHITDFGLAKWDAADFSIAADSQVLGTPAYMSPEQARGESHFSDCRTDVYALGVLLFQLLTGELPFRGNQEMLLHQIMYEVPPSPCKLDRRIRKDLETICLKCLEKRLSGRYESAQALANDLRRYLRGQPIEARPVSHVVRGWRWCQRKPSAAAALFLLVFIAVAGPIAAVYQAQLRGEAERMRDNAQLHAQDAMGLRAKSGAGPSMTFTLPLVSDRLASSVLQRGLEILDDPGGPTISDDAAAKLHLAMGVLSARQGGYEAALEHFHNANEALLRLREAAPQQPRYVAAAAFCHECLGQLYEVLEERDNAIRHQEAAVSEWRRLLQDHPERTAFRRSLAESLLRLSLEQGLAGRGESALDSVKQGSKLLDEIAEFSTDDPDPLYLLACELADCFPVLADEWNESPPQEKRESAAE